MKRMICSICPKGARDVVCRFVSRSGGARNQWRRTLLLALLSPCPKSVPGVRAPSRHSKTGRSSLEFRYSCQRRTSSIASSGRPGNPANRPLTSRLVRISACSCLGITSRSGLSQTKASFRRHFGGRNFGNGAECAGSVHRLPRAIPDRSCPRGADNDLNRLQLALEVHQPEPFRPRQLRPERLISRPVEGRREAYRKLDRVHRRRVSTTEEMNRQPGRAKVAHRPPPSYRGREATPERLRKWRRSSPATPGPHPLGPFAFGRFAEEYRFTFRRSFCSAVLT